MNPTKKSLIRVCERYCDYYKPGKKEELVCRGLEVLGKIRDCQRFFLEKIGGSTEFSLESDAIILRRVCSPCPWREHECDYRDPSVEEANPCGGVVLLALLLDAGDITEEDLEDL